MMTNPAGPQGSEFAGHTHPKHFVLGETAARYGLPIDQVIGEARNPEHFSCRLTATIVFQKLDIRLAEISRILHKNHTSLTYYANKINLLSAESRERRIAGEVYLVVRVLGDLPETNDPELGVYTRPILSDRRLERELTRQVIKELGDEWRLAPEVRPMIVAYVKVNLFGLASIPAHAAQGLRILMSSVPIQNIVIRHLADAGLMFTINVFRNQMEKARGR